MSTYSNIKLKRVYESVSKTDGIRLFADRLWPRGISKTSMTYDEWIVNLCPSHSLRKKWHNNTISYKRFCEAYRAELKQHSSKVRAIALATTQSKITLLTSAKTPTQSHLAVLRDVILENAEELHTDSRDNASSVCYSPLNEE